MLRDRKAAAGPGSSPNIMKPDHPWPRNRSQAPTRQSCECRVRKTDGTLALSSWPLTKCHRKMDQKP